MTITATNGGGTSEPSDPVAGRSSEGGNYNTSLYKLNKSFPKILVPGVVEIVETVQGDIKWRPPSQPNGIITGYQVIYSIYQLPSTKMMSDVLENTIIDFSIKNLSE